MATLKKVKLNKSHLILEVNASKPGIVAFNTISYTAIDAMTQVETSDEGGDSSKEYFLCLGDGQEFSITQEMWLEIWEAWTQYLDRVPKV